MLDNSRVTTSNQCWHKLCKLDELANGVTKIVELNGEHLYVTRLKQDIRVFDAICPHHASDLSFARISQGKVECPLHGWQFEVASGQCVRGGRNLIERQVKIENDILYVI